MPLQAMLKLAASYTSFRTLDMLSDIIEFLYKFLKLALRYLLAVIIVRAILIFSPANIQQEVGIAAVVESYRQWIGFALICSFVV